MRRSFDGLSALVRNHLGRDPLDGSGFLFVNRRRTQLKVLYFDGDGFCVWSKRLEQGQFAVQPSARAGVVALSGTGFQALLNYLFAWTELGATHIGIIQSLIATCRLQGISPSVYLTDVLQRVSEHPARDVIDLTPRRCKVLFADNPLRSDLDRPPRV
jgi:hypothetical protein